MAVGGQRRRRWWVRFVDRETTEARRFFRDADRYNVGRRGVTLPIRGPAGERALLTVTSNISEREWVTRRVLYMREFQIIPQLPVQLPAREAQCLSLAIKGLHNKTIAATPNVSTSIV